MQSRTKPRRVARGKKSGNSDRRVVIPRSITPSEIDTELVFTFSLHITGSSIQSYPLFTNSPYDVDPVLLSTNTQGFSEFSTLYQKYRTFRYSGHVEFQSAQGAPILIWVMHTNSAQGVSAGGSATDLSTKDGNRFAMTRILSHSYASTGHYINTFSHSVKQIVGSPAPDTDDSYAAEVTANPTQHTYLLFGGKDLTENSLDLHIRVRLAMRTRFYERKIFSS